MRTRGVIESEAKAIIKEQQDQDKKGRNFCVDNELLQFIKENEGIDDDNMAKRVYVNARGVFIVGNFEPELLFEIYNWNKENQNNIIELYILSISA